MDYLSQKQKSGIIYIQNFAIHLLPESEFSKNLLEKIEIEENNRIKVSEYILGVFVPCRTSIRN